MTETMEASEAAAAILREAGWKPHDTWGVYTRGPLVMGFDLQGGFHVKNTAAVPDGPDTPDDPAEAARWLVVRFAPETPENPLSSEATLAPIAPTGLVEGGDVEDAAGHETHVEARETDAGGARTGAALDEKTSAAAADDAEPSADERGVGGDSAGYGEESVEGPAEPLDADFAEPEAPAALEGDDLAEPPALEFSAEMAEHEGETGSVAYFGDDLPTMRLKKMGRLAQIAAEKTAAELAFANWSDDEFNAVQSHVVSNLNKATGAYTGDRQDLYNRFVELSQAQAMVATINRHRDVSIAYINAADTPRLMVEQFDPEAGWPG